MADRDATKAPALYKIAAEQGLPQAQYYYGKALKEGIGIARTRSTRISGSRSRTMLDTMRQARDLLDISTGGSLTAIRFQVPNQGTRHGTDGDSRRDGARMFGVGWRVR